VTRPQAAIRNSDGHAPLLSVADAPSPWDWTENSLPSEFPATPTDIPGMS
jgi:hypothetical protein